MNFYSTKSEWLTWKWSYFSKTNWISL